VAVRARGALFLALAGAEQERVKAVRDRQGRLILGGGQSLVLGGTIPSNKANNTNLGGGIDNNYLGATISINLANLNKILGSSIKSFKGNRDRPTQAPIWGK
jgi:hypothetical protein